MLSKTNNKLYFSPSCVSVRIIEVNSSKIITIIFQIKLQCTYSGGKMAFALGRTQQEAQGGSGPLWPKKKKKLYILLLAQPTLIGSPQSNLDRPPMPNPNLKKKNPLTLLTLQTDSDKIIIKKFKKINERDREKSRETETERE